MKALQTFIYCGAAAVILGIFNVWGLLQLYDAARRYNWPQVTGTIISSVARSKLMRGRHGEFITHWPDVRYEYVVGDKRFVSDRIMFTHRGFSESETQRLVDAYPVNKFITVYFDPRSPESAVLQPGIWWLFFPILGFGIILMIVMLWIAYADLRGQLPLQQSDVGMSTTASARLWNTPPKTYNYRGVIIFIVAMSFAAMFYRGLLPDAPLWPLIGTIAFSQCVIARQVPAPRTSHSLCGLMSAFGTKRTSNCLPAMSAFGGIADINGRQSDVRFSNRPVEVKRFQAIHDSGVNVTRGLALLYGLGTRPFDHGIRE